MVLRRGWTAGRILCAVDRHNRGRVMTAAFKRWHVQGAGPRPDGSTRPSDAIGVAYERHLKPRTASDWRLLE